MAVVDSGFYESQRRGIEDEYAAQMAANTFSRQLSQQRGSRQLSFMNREFQRAVPKFTASFGQRGFSGGGIRSGAMQRSMRNFIGDYNRDYTYAQNDLTDQLREYDLQGTQLGAQRNSALAEMELAKSREIAFAAQNIEALRSILGGI